MANKLTPDQQAQFINEVLEDWVISAQDRLNNSIEKKKGKIPSSVRNRLFFQILKATKANAAKVLLKFEDEGRIVEMKNIQRDGVAISRDKHFLLEWVRKKGLSKFRRGVPGYKDGGRKLTEEQKIMRIANAIAVSKKKGTGKKRRRVIWFNKTFYDSIGDLSNRLLKEQADFAARITKQDIQDAFNQ